MRLLVLAEADEAARREGFTPAGAAPARAEHARLRAEADALLGGRHPLHWPLEFPEAFSDGGFDAIIGNPPFIGGRRVRETLGGSYRDMLYTLFPGSSGNADYCAFFFLAGFGRLKGGGTLGLLATNTISQGDTRRTGLDSIVAEHGTIYRATQNQPWPGQAAVVVDVIHVARGAFDSQCVLDGQEVPRITALLSAGAHDLSPNPLVANHGLSYIGSFVNGMGFILESDEAANLIATDARNRDVLYPYLNGEDLNSRPDQSPSRWVINFFDWPIEKAETYTEPFKIVRDKVYPVRAKVNREAHRKYWWHYGDKRPALYRAIAPLRRVLVCARVSKYSSFAFEATDMVFSDATVIITVSDGMLPALLTSSLHEAWVRAHSSTLETRLRYTPSDVFDTFPSPALRG